MDKVAAMVMILSLASASMAAADGSWHGRSNESGGLVEHSYNVAENDPRFDPEMTEGATFAIRCDGFDKRLTISMTGDHDAAGEAAQKAIFAIDADRFERSGELGNAGLFPATPVIHTDGNDPLVAALMNGLQLKVFVGQEAGYPVFEADLNGTRALMSRHLGVCL